MIFRSTKLLQEKYSSKIELRLDEFSRLMSTRRTNGDIYDWFPMVQRFTRDFLLRLLKKEKLANSQTILDPFLGSGNVLVASLEKGMQAYGIDVSPLFWYISHVKTAKCSAQDFIEAIKFIESNRKNKDPNFKNSDVPVLSSFERLFEKKHLYELLMLKEKAHELQPKVREIFLFALVSELLTFSYAERNGKGLHVNKNKKIPSPIKTILIKLKNMKKDYEKFTRNISKFEAHPLLGDSRDFSTVTDPMISKKGEFPIGNVNIVITSPPYCNSADYIEMYKLEHWFLDFVKSYDDFKTLSYNTIRSHCTFPNNYEVSWTNDVIEEVCSKLDGLWGKKDQIPRMIRGYFDDLHKVFAQTKNILSSEGKVFVVIGNSSYRGIPLPTDLLLSEIAEDLGFKVEKITILRRIMTSGQQWRIIGPEEKNMLRESLLTFTM